MKPAPKKSDPLDDVIRAEQARKCKHPHLRFGRYGFELQCVDCSRRYVAVMKGFDIAEFGYGHPELTEAEVRHSPNEIQRDKPVEEVHPQDTKKWRLKYIGDGKGK